MAEENAAKIQDSERISVLYTSGSSGLNTNAKGSIQAQVLDLMGIENAAVVEDVSNKGGGNPINLEQLYRFDPDVILFTAGSTYSTAADDEAWQPLRAIEAGTYTPALAAGLKERLATVFNRGFWEGYYAGRPVAEHSEHYGSAATRRKVYVGKVTNFYKRISVAEVLVEAAPLAVGEEIFFMGATTGVAEQTLTELHGPDGQPAESVAQGELCAIRTPGVVRRGDQLYKFVDAQ